MKYELDHCTNLLKERKLILICDLDETLISATYLNGNYLNPNYRKPILVFPSSNETKNNYIYLKLRPYLGDFLEEMSYIFELHLMSMGSANHVQRCIDIIDPTGKYFGNRITSRNNIMDSNDKDRTTKKMFPGCSNIIISLDDNIIIWKNNPSLVKIKPLNYFKSLEKDVISPYINKENVHTFIEEYINKLERDLKDHSLLSLQGILKKYHYDYFKVLDEGRAKETKTVLPNISKIMSNNVEINSSCVL